ncbi:MAG: hypothetical protein WA902_12355 [Thermosynechococcaceae cyanobacterium]
MEITIFQRASSVLILTLFLFAPEIAKLLEEKSARTIAITGFSALIATQLDIRYFVSNYPGRAISIFVVSLVAFLVLLKYTDVFKNIKPKKKIASLRRKTIVNISRALGWFHDSGPEIYLIEIKKGTFSFVWNHFRILIMSILLFDHFLLKFLTVSFSILFLISATIYTILSFSESIKKHPLKIYSGAVLAPLALYSVSYLIFSYAGVKPPFLEDQLLVWFLGLDASNWLNSTIKLAVFTSTYFLLLVLFWTFFSLTGEFTLKKFLAVVKSILMKLPIFSRYKKKAERRQALDQGSGI